MGKYVIVNFCPATENDWIMRAKYVNCSGSNSGHYHCMLSENGSLFEACIRRLFISSQGMFAIECDVCVENKVNPWDVRIY